MRIYSQLGNETDRTRQYGIPDVSPFAQQFTTNVTGAQTAQAQTPSPYVTSPLIPPMAQQPKRSSMQSVNTLRAMYGHGRKLSRSPYLIPEIQQPAQAPGYSAGMQQADAIQALTDKINGQIAGVQQRQQAADQSLAQRQQVTLTGYRNNLHQQNMAAAQGIAGAPAYRQAAGLAANPNSAVAAGHQIAQRDRHLVTPGGQDQYRRFGLGPLGGMQEPPQHGFVHGYGADAQQIALQPQESSQERLARNFTGTGLPGADGIPVLQQQDGSFAATSQGYLDGLHNAEIGKFKTDARDSSFTADPNVRFPGQVAVDLHGQELRWDTDLGSWVDTSGQTVGEEAFVGKIGAATAPAYRAVAARQAARQKSRREANGGLTDRQISRLNSDRRRLRRAIDRGLSPLAAEQKAQEIAQKEERWKLKRMVQYIPAKQPKKRHSLLMPDGSLSPVAEHGITSNWAERMTSQDPQIQTEMGILQTLGIRDSNSITDVETEMKSHRFRTYWNGLEPAHKATAARSVFMKLRAMFAEHGAAVSKKNRDVTDLFEGILDVTPDNVHAVQEWLGSYLERLEQRPTGEETRRLYRQPGLYTSPGH